MNLKIPKKAEISCKKIIIIIIFIYMMDIMSTFWTRVAGTSNFK